MGGNQLTSSLLKSFCIMLGYYTGLWEYRLTPGIMYSLLQTTKQPVSAVQDLPAVCVTKEDSEVTWYTELGKHLLVHCMPQTP